jgi:hypothetical protein
LLKGGEIDWGDSLTVENNDIIDFNIDELKNEISIEGTGVYIPNDGIAKDDDALNLLEFNETRSLLMNDLLKLQTFLQQKYYEMINESDNILITTIFQDAPKSIRDITEKDLKQFLVSISVLLNYFKNKRTEQLLHINDSPKYLKKIYDQFMFKKSSIERCRSNQERMKLKSSELNLEEVETSNKLKLIISKTKELKKYVNN